MKTFFYCPTCKKRATNVYLDSLTGISVSQFSSKCSICDTPVFELSDRKTKSEEMFLKIPKKKLERKNIVERDNKRKGMYYGLISIFVALTGFAIPIPINAFPGIVAILLGRRAMILGASKIGKIGIILGFIDFMFLLLISMRTFYLL